ncbi:MAG TPA: zinc-ribbon domain-containing protein [Terriglobales bacterium]|nr:zinc-ribbon domain-containing protein [Terriglobales bacterium]
MAKFCTNCGAAMDEGAGFCSKCGKGPASASAGGAAAAPAAAPAAGGGLQENVAGMLAYVTIIPAIIFLVMEPYNRNRFIRFHAFQCIFLCVALIVIHIVLGFIPIIGWAISLLVSLVALALWIVLLMKAYGGQKFKIPVIGDIAEKQANA